MESRSGKTYAISPAEATNITKHKEARTTVSKTRVANLKHTAQTQDTVVIDRTSKWGNPFRIGEGNTRDEACWRYYKYLLNDANLMLSLGELRGKTLLCHCHPQHCHGDILKLLCDNPPAVERYPAIQKLLSKKITQSRRARRTKAQVAADNPTQVANEPVKQLHAKRQTMASIAFWDGNHLDASDQLAHAELDREFAAKLIDPRNRR